MKDKFKTVPSLDTQIAAGNGMLPAWDNSNYLAIINFKIKIASTCAETARCQYPVHKCAFNILYLKKLDINKYHEHNLIIMLLKLFLAFTLIPVAEIYLLIKIGYSIGALNTVLVVIITAFAGATLARIQGLQTMLRVRASLQQGIMPTEDLIDAMIIFAAGIVLLTPGFLTDIAGLLLLFPVTRQYFKRYLRSKFDQWIKKQTIYFKRYP